MIIRMAIILLMMFAQACCTTGVSVSKGGQYSSESSVTLEKEVTTLIDQYSGDEKKKDDEIWRKIKEIRDILLDRGYFVEKAFVLPSIIYEPGTKEEMLDNLLNFIPEEGRISPEGWIAYGPVDVSMSEGSPIEVIVIDKKENMKAWENSLKKIDSKFRNFSGDQ